MTENIAILLARLDSKRLPEKHFKKIGERSLIDICFQRLAKGKNYEVVLATSDRQVDQPLADWAAKKGVNCYRGNAQDLRLRIKGCLETFNAINFARVNADSPFIESSLLEEGFRVLKSSGADLYTNLFPRSFPYGYSVEVFRSDAFLKAIADNPESENVTTFFYNHPEKFKINNVLCPFGDLTSVKLTVDTRDDLEELRNLYNQNNDLFGLNLEDLVKTATNKND